MTGGSGPRSRNQPSTPTRAVRESLVELLRCPACRAERPFTLEIAGRDAREVRAGALFCGRCGHRVAIEHGIVDLLHDPPEFVVREAEGLGRFAQVMRRDGWDRERVLGLPYEEKQGYWFAQGTAMNQILATVDLPRGSTILDVGSNTCWASAILAERGLQVIALDIATHEMQGLRTAEWWFDSKNVFFERVLSVMFDPAIASASVDFVFCCEVLHHNDRRNLRRTFRELFRVLKPGGKLLVVNETLRTVRDPKLKPDKEVVEYEGYEHAFLRRTYVSAARRSGFEVELLGPWLHRPFRSEPWTISPATSATESLRMALANAVRRGDRAKRAFLAYKAYLAGNTSLYMVATRPAT
jgi:SAM-dependent methyltransferase